MQRKLRQVGTALKEQSCVSYAKIASASGFSNINLIVIKATPPDDFPLRDKYIHQLLKIFSLSPSSFHSFSLSFTRRFTTTGSWRVALKCLLLLHRLLRSVPADSLFRSEILWSSSNGLLSLYPCHFRDSSSSCSAPEYTVFIRSYALLLDEALGCDFLDRKQLFCEEQEAEGEGEEGEGEGESEGHEKIQAKMKETGDILEMLPQLQSFMDRVMGCVPMEKLTQSSIVRSAMAQIIRDSFVCYTQFRIEITVVLDNLLQMPYKNFISAFSIYKKAAVQTSQLSQFYDWCKAKGFCFFYEYPLVDRIPLIQIQALETFLEGMWELTESPSLPATPSSPSSSSADSEKMVVMTRDGDDVAFGKHQNNNKLDDDKEEKPLIDLEDDGKKEMDDSSWEALLESSISFSHDDHQSDFCFWNYNNGGLNKNQQGDDAGDSWKKQLDQPVGNNNPFSQPNFDIFYYNAKHVH